MVFTSFSVCLSLFLMLYKNTSNVVIALVITTIILITCIRRNKSHNHNHLLDIDSYAQNSPLSFVNTGVKLAFALIVLLICSGAKSVYVMLFVSISMGMVIVLLGKIPFNKYLSMMSTPLCFISLGAVAIMVQFGQHEIGLSFIGVTKSSQYEAAIVSLRAIAGISCLYFVGLTTTMGDIIACLNKIHIPKILIELMYMIYRYIFVIYNIQSTMSQSAASRLGYTTSRQSIKTNIMIASQFLQLSFKQTSNHFSAMESRCYTGSLSFYREENELNYIHIMLCTSYIILVLFAGIIKF